MRSRIRGAGLAGKIAFAGIHQLTSLSNSRKNTGKFFAICLSNTGRALHTQRIDAGTTTAGLEIAFGAGGSCDSASLLGRKDLDSLTRREPRAFRSVLRITHRAGEQSLRRTSEKSAQVTERPTGVVVTGNQQAGFPAFTRSL